MVSFTVIQFLLMAEREGFEPPDPCGSTVFKTAAIDHSATSPMPKYIWLKANMRILYHILGVLCVRNYKNVSEGKNLI